MRISFDQLEAFVIATETGSFSAAARKLGKAQSAVSTMIANLEIDLGVQLFDRSKKYPVPTEEGEVLLRNARTILMHCIEFENRAHGFSNAIDARIRITVDEIVPRRFLVGLLERFGKKFPETELELLYGSLKDIQTLVEEGRADIGLLVPFDLPDKSVAKRLLTYMTFCPVAAREHPLAKLEKNTPAALESYRQFCITSRGGEREPDTVIHGNRSWMVESSYVIKDLVCKGLGYAFLPLHLVKEDIASGRLIRLPVNAEQISYKAPIYLVWSSARLFGKAGKWLMKELSKIEW